MKTLSTSILISALLAVAAHSASASVPRFRYEPHATVYAGDLDLGRQPDAQTLYERISYAAQAICTSGALSVDVRKRRHWRECVETAVTEAVERANAPLLMAIHLQQREQLARL